MRLAATPEAYLEWTARWLEEAMVTLVLCPGSIALAELGKRETCDVAPHVAGCASWQFHDLIIWDRVVGYN